jgi:hypothetical protein
VLGVGARAAVAEHDELAAAVEPAGHGVAGQRHGAGLLGEVVQGRDPAFEQLGGADGGRHR